MSDLEVFTFDIKTDMQKLESDIKNEITGQAADVQNHTWMVASGVVAQMTAEVHHVSYKMDDLKVDLDGHVDYLDTQVAMLSAKLDAQTKHLKSVLCLTQILMMIWVLVLLETVQPRLWVVVNQDLANVGALLMEYVDYLREFLPETPKTEKAPETPTPPWEDRENLRVFSEGLIHVCNWFILMPSME